MAENNKTVCMSLSIVAALAAIAAIVYVVRCLGKSNFANGNTAPNNPQVTLQAGPNYQNAKDLIGYGPGINVNPDTSPQATLQMGNKWVADVRQYNMPSRKNLELASNQPLVDGSKGSCDYFNTPNSSGGYMDMCGGLGNQIYPPVNMVNDRATQLSQCALKLPFFAASSLLPKSNPNADLDELNTEAQQALAAITNLTPGDQGGYLTNWNYPQGKIASTRPAPQIENANLRTPPMLNVAPIAMSNNLGGLLINRGANNINAQGGVDPV